MLGCSLSEMKSRITPFEFALWQAYFEAEPSIGDRLDFHFANMQAMLANMMRKKKSAKVFKLADFFIDFREAHRKFIKRKHRGQSPKDVAATLMTWAMSFGTKKEKEHSE